MPRALTAVSFALLAFFISLDTQASGQAANASIGFTSLVTNQLVQPNPPVITTHGTGGVVTWSYVVVAVDEAGGTTSASTAGSTATGNATLGVSNYNIITTSPVSGAQSCNIYRTVVGTSPTTTGKIGNIACGGVLNDTALVGDMTSAPSANTTGGINVSGNLQAANMTATGTVSSQAFNATGSAAGIDILTNGSPLSACGIPPCVTSASEFFLQSASSISTSYGWTLPNSANTAAQLLYLSAPFTDTGGKNASTVGYITSDSTTTHALFATAGAPAFRVIGTNDTTPNYFAAATGSANHYVVPITGATLTAGTVVSFSTSSNPNNGASDINVNSLGVKNLTKNGTSGLNFGDILTGVIYNAVYDGTEWQLTNPSTGAASALTSYFTNPTAATANAVSFSGSANQATIYGIVIPAPGVVTSQISYENQAADNSAHTYDIGIYAGIPSSGGESPLVHIGSTAGTTFAPSTGQWHTLSWSGSTTIYLSPGRYYVAITSSCTASCATIAGQLLTMVFGNANEGLTAGGSLTSISTPADLTTGINITTPTFWLH